MILRYVASTADMWIMKRSWAGRTHEMEAEEILAYLAGLLLMYLEELRDAKQSGENSFRYGEQTAYTECLEIIQEWEGATGIGLDFDIEKRYPL